MAIDISREELRADILEITTAVVNGAIKDSNRNLIRMIDEDLDATNRRIDNLDRRLTKRIGALQNQVGETNSLLRAHILNPSAHVKA